MHQYINEEFAKIITTFKIRTSVTINSPENTNRGRGWGVALKINWKLIQWAPPHLPLPCQRRWKSQNLWRCLQQHCQSWRKRLTRVLAHCWNCQTWRGRLGCLSCPQCPWIQSWRRSHRARLWWVTWIWRCLKMWGVMMYCWRGTPLVALWALWTD